MCAVRCTRRGQPAVLQNQQTTQKGGGGTQPGGRMETALRRERGGAQSPLGQGGQTLSGAAHRPQHHQPP